MEFSGIVQKGSAYGRTLGFPTANIDVADANVSGIFAALVTLGEVEHRAAVYVSQKNSRLEAYILDFDGDVYGREMRVRLLKKIRDDRAFVSAAEARATIAADVRQTREYFAAVN